MLYSEHFDQAQRRSGGRPPPGKLWPCTASGVHGGARSLRQSLEPLLSQQRVPLVLAGHEHFYERLEAKGIVHIVSGGGGAWLRSFVSARPQSIFRRKSPNYLTLEATTERLQVTAFNEKNEIIDRVELKK